MKKRLVEAVLGVALAVSVVITSPVSSLAYDFSVDEKLDIQGVKDTYNKEGMLYCTSDTNLDTEAELYEAKVAGKYLNVTMFKYNKGKDKGVKVKSFTKVTNVLNQIEDKTFVVTTAGKPADTYTKYQLKGKTLKVVVKYSAKKVKGKAKYYKNGKEVKKAAYKKFVKQVKKASIPLAFNTSGYPWIDSNVLGYAGAVGDVGVNNDAHLSLNYDYLSVTDDVDNKTSSGGFSSDTADATLARKKDIATGKAGSGTDATMMRDLFFKEKDLEARGKEWKASLKKDVDAITAIKSVKDMTNYLTDTTSAKPTRFIDFGSVWHSGMPGIRIAQVDYDALCGSMEFRFFDETAAAVLRKAGFSKKEATTIVENGKDVSEFLVEGYYSDEKVAQKWPIDHSGYFTGEEAASLCRNFPLIQIMEAFGSKVSTYGMALQQPPFLKNLDSLYNKKGLSLLKDYLLYVTAYRAIASSDADTMMDAINETGKGMTFGLKKYDKVSLPEDPAEREDYLFDLYHGNGSFASIFNIYYTPVDNNSYVSAYYTDAERQKLRAFVDDLVSNYEEMLKEEDWMTDATKQAAIEKLKAMQINVLYPDTLPDTSHLKIDTSDSLYDSYYKIKDATWKHFAENEGKSVRQQGWRWDLDLALETTQLNSFYDPTMNTVYILGGYYDGKGDITKLSDEVIYGYLGLVVGHEISHAFDSSGAAFDKYGMYAITKDNPSGWWAKEDWETFGKKVEKMAKYYDGVSPLNSVSSLNGSSLTGEAIADMGGMAVLLRMAKKNPSFDYKEFFKTYASGIFLYKTTTPMDMFLSYIDEHPLGFLRTNVTVAQFDEFYETFNVNKGDGMYVAPEDRIKIW